MAETIICPFCSYEFRPQNKDTYFNEISCPDCGRFVSGKRQEGIRRDKSDREDSGYNWTFKKKKQS